MLSSVARDPRSSSKDWKGGDPSVDERSNAKLRQGLKEPRFPFRSFRWPSKKLRSEKPKRFSMENVHKLHPQIKPPQSAVSLRSKEQKSIAMERLPKRGVKCRKPLEYSNTTRDIAPRRCIMTGRAHCKDLFLDCIEIALSTFNKNSLSEQGPEYKFVEALDYMQILENSVYHCNFIARRKNEPGADNELFFAEVKCAGGGPVCCPLCCILGPSGTETGLSGCTFCEDHTSLIQHPPKRVRFTRK